MCRVTISGPEPDADGVQQMIDAVATAIEAGWSAPRISIVEEPEDLDEPSGDELGEGAILDYRVFGYTDGAIILVVLDEDDLMQASLAVTSLAQHLTTWSPGLLVYTPDEVRISRLDKPYDDENWLPPIDDASDDDSERPRFHLGELIGGDLQEVASDYLLAQAIWSLWHPADPVESHRARNVVHGAVEDPWGQELTSALGPLLMSAARLEHRHGTRARLVIQGAGAPELAADLLRRAREVVPGAETDGWEDDETRGHVLVSAFMQEHQLLWDRTVDGESPGEYENRRNRQLKELLWAGLRVLATMAMELSHLSGPWQVLHRLGGGTIASVLAEKEEEENEDAAAEDQEETQSAAAALLLVWLATWRPELVETPAAVDLAEQVAEDTSTFRQVLHSVLQMVGSGALNAALEARPAPAELRDGLGNFVGALETMEDQDDFGLFDEANEGMHEALGQLLEDETDVNERIRYLVLIAGDAARLTDSDANPRRVEEGYVGSPSELTYYLLVEPAMHAVVMLHRRDDDEAVRARMLSLAAEISPAAAGGLAADFPDLTGEDPRLEPASRARAQRWVENAVQAVRAYGAVLPAEKLDCGADALTLFNAAASGQPLPADWPVDRLIAAAAEAAAAALHAVGAADLTDGVFDEHA